MVALLVPGKAHIAVQLLTRFDALQHVFPGGNGHLQVVALSASTGLQDGLGDGNMYPGSTSVHGALVDPQTAIIAQREADAEVEVVIRRRGLSPPDILVLSIHLTVSIGINVIPDTAVKNLGVKVADRARGYSRRTQARGTHNARPERCLIRNLTVRQGLRVFHPELRHFPRCGLRLWFRCGIFGGRCVLLLGGCRFISVGGRICRVVDLWVVGNVWICIVRWIGSRSRSRILRYHSLRDLLRLSRLLLRGSVVGRRLARNFHSGFLAVLKLVSTLCKG